MDRTGIYGLFDFDGAPPDPQALAALGLAGAAANNGHVAAVTDLADPDAAQSSEADGTLTLLLGRLDDPAMVAKELGLVRDTPQVELARAALDRFGPDMRTRLHGEWTLVRWDGRALTLAASICRRDPLHYAVRGARVAIGPDLRQLSRIAWIGDTFDPAGLLMAMGSASLRAPGDARTPLKAVCALAPGAFLTITPNGPRTAPDIDLVPDADPEDDLASAMDRAEAMMLKIVRQRMVGGRYACMVSGGLDSSTLAWAAANALQSDERLWFLTSAAAPGSGQHDEMAEAAIVAAHLGIGHDPVPPRDSPGAYRPDPVLFRDSNGPSLDIRHYLYHRFAQQTRARGAAMLLDGQFGELTFTYPLPLYARPSVVQRVRAALRTRLRSMARPALADAFHVSIAPHWHEAPPAELAAALCRPPVPVALPARGACWGVSAGFAKATRAPASLDLGRVRVAMPFRDPRLIALFAGWPASMLYPQDGGRSPARQLLVGKLPDSIRQRPKGPGFAPDYSDRLRDEAAVARARVALFRRAGADEWIDLAALEMGLERSARGANSHDKAVQTQLTALAGEFIAWWRGVS